MVPLVILLEACDMDISANAIKLPKHHVAPHVNCLDLRNAMMPLTTLSASHDARAGANGVTWPESHIAPHLICLDLRNDWWCCPHHMMLIPRQWHYMTPMPMRQCDASVDVSGIKWQKVMLHFISVVLTWRMQWYHFWCHWHHVIQTPKPMLHIILIILTKQMYWSHWWWNVPHMMLIPWASHDKKVMLHLLLIILT